MKACMALEVCERVVVSGALNIHVTSISAVAPCRSLSHKAHRAVAARAGPYEYVATVEKEALELLLGMRLRMKHALVVGLLLKRRRPCRCPTLKSGPAASCPRRWLPTAMTD